MAPPLPYQWLRTSDEAFASMLQAIEGARRTIRFEFYIFTDGELARRFRDALLAATRRGVKARVLIDAVGSLGLSSDFWAELIMAGGQFRWFNPITLHRVSLRDHRKVLVCDEEIGFVGGFNIAPEYEGDGVTRGWFDLGMRFECRLAAELARAFDDMFANANMEHTPLQRLKKSAQLRAVNTPDGRLLLSAPGRGQNGFKPALYADLKRARNVQIISAYFLPTWRIRRDLIRIARSGGVVQLMLAGPSDIALSQNATKSLYHQLLRAGIEIYEYQPQVLHAKLILVDRIVYVGSANLDTRSLKINYELLVRIPDGHTAEGGRALFQERLQQCRRVTLQEWKASTGWWTRFKQKIAYYILVRLDLYFAKKQLRAAK